MKVDLPEKLMEICEFVGVSSIPSETNIDKLATMIQLTYPSFCLEEIELAFMLACSGKLNVKVEVYGSFGAQMLGAVFNAYKIYKQDVMKGHGQKELPEHQYSEAEYDEMAYNSLDKFYSENRKFPAGYLYGGMFQHIVRNKLFEMTEPEYLALRGRVHTLLKDQYKTKVIHSDLLEVSITEEIVKQHFRIKYPAIPTKKTENSEISNEIKKSS